jgi:hypothetical protein
MPRALLFEQVSEVAGGLFGVVLCGVLYSRDCVVWLALRTRVDVIVATPLVLVVVVAACVVLALAANGVVIGFHLVLFIGL